jgi:hypothetical protein
MSPPPRSLVVAPFRAGLTSSRTKPSLSPNNSTIPIHLLLKQRHTSGHHPAFGVTALTSMMIVWAVDLEN